MKIGLLPLGNFRIILHSVVAYSHKNWHSDENENEIEKHIFKSVLSDHPGTTGY